MRNKIILWVAAIVLFLMSIPTVNAQRKELLKERGALFITSVSFSQGIVRLPYENGFQPAGSSRTIKGGLPCIEITQFLGYQFNPYLMLGVGVGFDYWTTKNAFVPLYVDFRVNMMNNRFAPHWYINLGYANRWYITSKPYKAGTGNTSEYIIHGSKSGVLAETGFGVKINATPSTGIILTAFARFQESALRYYGGTSTPAQSVRPLLVDTDENSMYIAIGIKAGIAF